MALASIIIPTKNIPSLLQRCLDSIPPRDDVQIIVVDDNSDPTVVDFDRYPGHDRPDVELIFNKEALGAGHARNVGLERATGQWLMFVDSDDLILPEGYEKLLANLDDTCDIIYTLPRSVDSETLQPADRDTHRRGGIEAVKHDSAAVEEYLRYKFTEPWAKVIRHDLIKRHGIRFDETLVANDYLFSVMTGYYAGKIKLIDTEFYCLSVRQGSLCNNAFDSEKKVLERARAYYNVQRFFDRHHIPLYPAYEYYFVTPHDAPQYAASLKRYYKSFKKLKLGLFLKVLLRFRSKGLKARLTRLI